MEQRHQRRRIRSVRKEDVRSQLEQRLIWLGIGQSRMADASPDLVRRLARALRRERRAARCRIGNGYDPLRHLLLVRFARLCKGKRLREALLAPPLKRQDRPVRRAVRT